MPKEAKDAVVKAVEGGFEGAVITLTLRLPLSFRELKDFLTSQPAHTALTQATPSKASTGRFVNEISTLRPGSASSPPHAMANFSAAAN